MNCGHSCAEVFRMFEGYYGPYFTPSVDADGNLTWTNNAGLPNPPAINIKGEPGTGLEISGLVATEADLPATAEDWTCYLVGTEVPYTVYTFDPNTGWISLGQLASGPKGDPGAVYTPSVSPEGLLSWTNDGGLPNPQPVNIKGPKGDTGGGSGLTEDVKQALLQIAQKVVYIDAHGDDYYQDLYDALYPPANLVSISAAFNQGSTVVYDTDTLDSLRPMLTVTATYDDQSTTIVSSYTLSGTLTTGISTITVTYQGKTDTFAVTVTHEAGVFFVTNNLTGATNSNSATSVTEGNSYSGTITASAGYTLTGATVSITMGGTDITSTAYNNGAISVASVTGALVITVSAAVVALSSISAVYTQSGTVYDTDSLNSLKDDLVVTATYSDSTTAVIPAADYTLSGTLAVGTSTITVSYGGKTDTFNVIVSQTTHEYLYNWNFKQSLTDTEQSAVAEISSNMTQTSNGVSLIDSSSAILLPTGTYGLNRRIEVDFAQNETWSRDGNGGASGGNGAVIGFTPISNITANPPTDTLFQVLFWRGTDSKYEMYINNAWQDWIDSNYSASMSQFSGKTMYVNIDGTGIAKIGYVDNGVDVQIGLSQTAYSPSTGSRVLIGRGAQANGQAMHGFTVEAIRIKEVS